MRFITANESTASRRRVYFQLVDATDGITPETGEAGGQPQISSDGGAWTNTGINSLTAIGNGRYYADLTQTAVANAGTSIETRYKSANTAECPGDSVQVIAVNLNDTVRAGLTALPNAAIGTLNGLISAGDGSVVPYQLLVGNTSGVGGFLGSNTIRSSSFQGNSITATAIAEGAITASEVSTDAAQEIANAVWRANITNDYAISPDPAAPWADNTMGKRLLRSSSNTSNTEAQIVSAVWDELETDITASGSIGLKVKNNLNDTITSRMATFSLPSNFSLLAINGTGQVTVGTNNDKTGYSLATAPPTAANVADAVWGANITNNSTGSPWSISTMGRRVYRSSSDAVATEAQIADAVWDEPRNDHNSGNTTGHSLDQIRKANYTTPGTINDTTGATTTSFRTNLTGVNGTFDHQTILFVNSAALNGQSAPILSYAQTNGLITLGDGLTVAPSLNDEFVILPTHVYPMSYMVANILAGDTSTTTYAAGDVGNVLARLHNMIQTTGADFQFDATALALAPTGGGGGGSTIAAGNVPYQLRADTQYPDGAVDIYVGTLLRLDMQVQDRDGNAIDLTGGTVTVGVRNASTGATVGTDQSATLSLARLGMIYVDTVADWSATAGTYRITVSATVGTDVIIAGPLPLIVRSR